ncbi:L,D-transpeptidase [Aliarcobacter trophiarum]|uniref:L,D-transpeptidase n=1 Tax=Aliarcobacter trophiarum TaxID=708186 RepID=UPI00100ACF19|nr:L,D-transpeptidase [Aliarcobacter trophiarum]RXI27795.1 L,D-transpeptidase [Aliarcobacter trophiarum]
MKKSIILIPFLSIFLFANSPKYTIAVCATANLENALFCKKRIFDNMDGEVFIVKQNNRYFTNINIYTDKEKAQIDLKNSSKYVKEQKPYVKALDENIAIRVRKDKLFIDMDNKTTIKQEIEVKKQNIDQIKEQNPENSSINIPIVSMIPENLEILGSLPYNIEEQKIDKTIDNKETNIKNELKSDIDFGNQVSNDNLSKEDEEELLQTSLNEFDLQQTKEPKSNQSFTNSYEKKVSKPLIQKANIKNLMSYDELIVKVDSKTNIMELFAKSGQNEQKIKSYIVSTGKNSIKKPLGEGRISQISLNPVWYPTADTKRSFEKKGILLPDVVPPNHKYNYMGLAKLNLTHSVDGNTTYRIHGTLNEKTLGSNESAGCIRMKNNDVVELAILLEEFAKLRSLNKVKVILI